MEDHLKQLKMKLLSSDHQKFSEKLKIILDNIDQFSQDISHIGIASAQNNDIFVNMMLLAKFLEVKRNSVNHNLQRMGYKLDFVDRSNELLAQVPNLSVWPRTWSKRIYDKNFRKGNEDVEEAQVGNTKAEENEAKEAKEEQEEEEDQGEEDPEIFFDEYNAIEFWGEKDWS
jgi:hypothetical protein